MPSFYNYAPQEIRDLPFNLRRSQLYPVNVPTFTQAAQEHIDGAEPPIGMFPKKMAFTRYKNGPAAKEMGSSAVGVTEAVGVYDAQVRDMFQDIPGGKGVFTTQQASDHFVRLPQPMEDWRASTDPLARGMSDKPTLRAGELNAFADLNRTPISPEWNESTYVEPVEPIQASIPWNRTPLGGRRMRKSTPLAGIGQPGSPWATAYAAASVAGMGMGAYHGYKRENSGWAAIGWGLLGGIFPIIVIPVMLAQGFGERK